MEEKNLPSIYSFVEEGKKYIQKLSRWMMDLLYLTPLRHQDQRHLPAIVEGKQVLKKKIPYGYPCLVGQLEVSVPYLIWSHTLLEWWVING